VIRRGRLVDDADRDRQIRTHVLAALEEAGLYVPVPAPERSAVLLIDVDWIAGSQCFGWWTSRQRTTTDCLDGLSELFGASFDRGVIGVVDERAGLAVDDGDEPRAILTVAVADPAGHIRRRAQPGDVVVTGRAMLTQQLMERGIEVIPPKELSQWMTTASYE